MNQLTETKGGVEVISVVPDSISGNKVPLQPLEVWLSKNRARGRLIVNPRFMIKSEVIIM